MRVLWLCNTVPSELCEVFGFKKHFREGWITGMLNEIKKNSDIDLGLCLPIRNPERMKDGQTGFYQYYSFLFEGAEVLSGELTKRFVEIICDFKPDIVHIWGSEYGQSLAMVRACERAGILKNTVIHIQGLISACVPYYMNGIDYEWIERKGENGDTIENGRNRYFERGVYEVESLSKARYALGRTDWDKAYIKSISPIDYRYCGEVLRDEFYCSDLLWDKDMCIPHSIFVTQGSYSIKGIHLLVPAIALLKSKYPDISVFISGGSVLMPDYQGEKNPYGEYLIHLMDKYDVNDIFHFVGPLGPNEMIDRFLKSNVMVISSTIENSSNSIGEAQILGVPVIASYTGGTPSLIEHGKTGLMYQMDAPYMLASYIERIFDDGDYATEIANNACKAAKKRYDPGRVSSQLYDIYKEVTSNVK